jgi:tetratricopeptide (TPR) repeat protein
VIAPRLPSRLRQGELERLAVLLRHATGGAWAIALYNTVAVRDQVMEDLRSRLAPLPVYDFTFTAERANPLAYLEQLPAEVREKRAIIFLYDLTRGGERVWGYLEMQREALADHPHGLIFWLTLGERREAVRRAPNFWSQRSGVFDFAIADETALAQARGQWVGQSVRFVDRADWERQVRLYQGLVEEYEQSDDAPADTLLDLYDKLAHLYYTVNDYRQAGELARRQQVLAEESGDHRRYAEALNSIGLIYRALGDNYRALEYYERALRIRREIDDRAGEAATLNNIGVLHDKLGEKQQALRCYAEALSIAREVGDQASEAAALSNIRTV